MDELDYQPIGTPAVEQPGKKRTRFYVLGAAGLVLTAGLVTVGLTGSSSHKAAASPPVVTHFQPAATAAEITRTGLHLQIIKYQGDMNTLNQNISTLTAQIKALTPAAPAQLSGQANSQIQNLTNMRNSDLAQADTLTAEIITDQAKLDS